MSTIKIGRAKTTSTILDKHDKFINGFEHSCSLQQAEAEVKTILQATILLILFNCTSHVYNETVKNIHLISITGP